jgi:hypothetical protein
VVRLRAVRTGRLYSQKIPLILISVRDWVNPKAIVRPGGLCQWKDPVTPSRIKPWQWKVLSSTPNPLTAGSVLYAVCYFLFDTFGNVVRTNIYELGVPGSNLGSDKRFLSAPNSWPALGPTQPPIQWLPGIFFPGVLWSESEAGHSPPSGVEVKNEWTYTSIHPVYLHGVLYIDGFTV